MSLGNVCNFYLTTWRYSSDNSMFIFVYVPWFLKICGITGHYPKRTDWKVLFRELKVEVRRLVLGCMPQRALTASTLQNIGYIVGLFL
jgi:hypothetical protein